MLEEKWLIKTALSKPSLLKELIDVGAIEDAKTNSLLKVAYQQYKKNNELPSLEYLKTKAPQKYKEAFTTYELNNSDIDVFYKSIEDFTKETFILDFTEKFANKEFDFTDIKHIYKENVKEYSEKIETHKSVSSLHDIKDILKEFDNEDKTHVKTGYRSIDEYLKNGGWKPGSVYCVMGLTGIGKSIFLTNFAARLIDKKNVLFITTEMNHIDTYERILYSYFDADSKANIQKKILYHPEQYNIKNIEVFKVHPNDTTTSDIEDIVDTLEWKPDAIIIDYFDEIRATEKTNNDYDKHGIVSSDMKKLAEVLDVPIITATQTNRQAEGEFGGTKDWVGMNSIADSQKKVRQLDVLFSIVQNTQEKEDGVISLSIVKNRYGPMGNISFHINYKKWRLSDDYMVTHNEWQNRSKKPKSSGLKGHIDVDTDEIKDMATNQGMNLLDDDVKNAVQKYNRGKK